MEENCSNKCRACLTEGEPMLSLFEVYEHDLTLAMILTNCISNIQISEDDGLPPYICDSCILIVTQFYNFTVIYEESDRHLRSLCTKEIELLQSPVEVELNSYKQEQESEFETPNHEEEDEDEDAESKDSSSNDFLVDESQDDDLIAELESPSAKESEELTEFIKTENDHTENEMQTVFEDVVKYECTICGEEHLYATPFQQHMRVKHQMTDIDCESYASKVRVKVYQSEPKAETQTPEVKLECADSDLICKFCSKQFSYVTQLQQHLKLHDVNKKYVCEVCGARFIRKTYLDDHKEGHSTEKKHVCKFCGKAFRRRTVLRAHKRVHTHPNHYVCEVCGRAFTNSSTLKTHKLLIHIRERNFHCVICNLSFPLKSTLNKHIIRHQKRENGEKGFSCSQCPMQYKDKSSLKRHVDAKHQGKIELIPCYGCPRKYSSKANLMKHIRRHHSPNMVVAEEVVL
ncbi:hypothetical protein PPYR_11134 [Photinus pyralis]|uniref:Protein krueppel n=1 Tax=Photinus pyralis TaxID=7054 RepID=A0A1Y1LF46_PHOPY|nr:zinc finger protein 567-like [Photinus pyralis]KAB0794295.1 hypothetical protein PPYR_11134 [Photinus pyralis]